MTELRGKKISRLDDIGKRFFMEFEIGVKKTFKLNGQKNLKKKFKKEFRENLKKK